jgi:hypothetical protein
MTLFLLGVPAHKVICIVSGLIILSAAISYATLKVKYTFNQLVLSFGFFIGSVIFEITKNFIITSSVFLLTMMFFLYRTFAIED